MSEEKLELQLINRLLESDGYAFDKIFNRYNVKVYAFALRNLRNKEEAEGVVQDVFMCLWNDREKLKDVRDLDAWVFTITFNIIRKKFRRLAKERNQLKELKATRLLDDNSTIDAVEYKDLLSNLESIIDRLPERQKSVFLLSRKSGLNNTEISIKLNISRKTVENHLSNAKKFLKKTFMDENLLSLIIFMFILN